jgi:SAM-dependent methyltransferase
LDRPLYTTFAWAYDLVVPPSAAPQPDEAARLFAGRKTLVDVGCGTGLHTAYLASADFSVVGIDASEAMVDLARRRAPSVEFNVADLRNWRPAEPVDGVLCRGVLDETIADEDRQDEISALYEMARPGGLLLLSVREIEKTRARYSREPVVTRSESGVFFRSERRFIADRVTVEETISSSDARADYRFEMRPWSLSEVDARTQAAGFARVERRIEGDRIVALCIR